MSRLPLSLLLAAALPSVALSQKIVAWGDNDAGQASVPAGLVANQVACGSSHSMGLKPDGTVSAWGSNLYGQLNVPAGLVASQIAVGSVYSVALKTDGTVMAWGSNVQGQLNVPAGLDQVTQIAAGGSHALALRANGSVVGWQRNDFGQSTPPAGLVAKQVSAGELHSMALRTDGSVAVWGNNYFNQLIVPAGLVATQIASGDYHCLALRSDGTVVGWGRNASGETVAPNRLRAIQISAGGGHSLALRADGTVAAWGANGLGQCDVPIGLTGVLQVSAGYSTSMAVVAAAHCVIDQEVIYAGASATGTVRLAHPAHAGGAVVALTCDTPNVHIPATVTIPAGATERTFPVTTDVDFTTRTATIATSFNGTATVPAKLVVLADSVNLGLSRSIVYGGSTTNIAATLGVSFTSPQESIFDLSSDNAAVTVPATVRLRPGYASANFPVSHRLTGTDQTATITVRKDGVVVATTTLTVKPIGGALSLSPSEVFGGDSSGGTVTLSAPVAAPMTVILVSSRTEAAVPASVVVPAGAKTTTFLIETVRVGRPISALISSTANGKTANAALQIVPRSNLHSVTLPTYLYGHQRVAGTVRLTSPAPAGGQAVSLASSDPGLIVPASVTVPAGATSVGFVAEGADVAFTADVTVSAQLNGDTVSAETEVRALTISSLALSASTVAGGGTATGTVTLNVPVSVATTVSLTSDNAGVASVNAVVVIPAGSKTGTFTITTHSPGRTARNVKITAMKNDTSAYRTLKVIP
ncbi:hypothetical protein EON81_13590 [bacterium]|nr:MAG: hypothetical protein EON81_13590 [bacterium]